MLAMMLEWWARRHGARHGAPVAISVFALAALLAGVVAVNGSDVLAHAWSQSSMFGTFAIVVGIVAIGAVCVVPYRLGRPMMSIVGVVTADLLAVAVVVRIALAALRGVG